MNHYPELMEQFFQLRKNIYHLHLSETVSGSLFGLLKIIQKHSETIQIRGVQCKAMKVNDLYAMMHISRPAISKTLKECEKNGYVFKEVSEKDKRYMYVGISELGYSVLTKGKEEIEDSLNWILSHFNEEEREEMVKSISKMNRILIEFKKGREICGD